jgi:uncharacterized membrane protein YeaQ/YmgE (transglycosylase-associated protein family)
MVMTQPDFSRLQRDSRQIPGVRAMEFVYYILIGLAAGWLAGQIMKGGGFGLLGDLVVGVLGSLLGGWIFGLLGIYAGGIIGNLIVATIGAILLLAILRAVQRRRF